MTGTLSLSGAINRHGRISGLINDFTASSATLDAYDLQQTTNAMLIGQLVADPIDEFGNDSYLLRLPHYGAQIQVMTAVINSAQTRYGIPDIVVAPALSDWLTRGRTSVPVAGPTSRCMSMVRS